MTAEMAKAAERHLDGALEALKIGRGLLEKAKRAYPDKAADEVYDALITHTQLIELNAAALRVIARAYVGERKDLDDARP